MNTFRNLFYPVTIHKRWRIDLKLWEEKKQFLGLITFYEYSIFKQGVLNKFTKLSMIPYPKYFDGPVITKIYIGKKEFQQKYKSNKYLVPLNVHLDLNLP